jgi:CheY-like chemotaxis protein
MSLNYPLFEGVIVSDFGSMLIFIGKITGGIMARILVIEDDWDSRILVKYILQWQGNEIAESANDLDALNLLKFDSRFDLIISTIRSPFVSGLSLMSQIQAQGLFIPMIFLTTQYPFGNERPNVYLLKPFTGKQLMDEVNKVLAMFKSEPLTDTLVAMHV